ncbi:MAG: low molecular weight protein-tyrosine-phosphatase [Neisseria sp.]|nr:low molecular weight protein-tyrosine-phosphatase [Neisseria sp.]
MKQYNILFVCLGNICRSPMAEYVLRQQAAENGVSHRVQTASAGTSGWHNGEDMHRETAAILRQHGIAPTGFVSSQVQNSDIDAYDFIIAMDDNNLAELEKRFGKQPEKVFKLTDLIPESGYKHVPDPWYTGDFAETYRLVQTASAALLKRLGLTE